ncbi:MAG TPA: electron transfer flavoprotein, partial [Thermodesulfobacteriota bacterium]|nr:electron transfer flavoprotein [Thermodesulfobacteriota bacterium]
MLLYAFAQLRVVSEKFGINHFFLFWGFMVLLLINLQFIIAGIFPRFSFEFLGTIPYGVLRFMADVMSLVVLVSVVVAVIRRAFFRPPHIEATFEAFFILALVAFLMIAYFGLHACEIQLGEEQMTNWIPISYGLSNLFNDAGIATTHVLSHSF